MTIDDERLLHDLAALDPARYDRPPGPGSARRTAVLDRAIAATDSGTGRERSGPAASTGTRWARRTVLAVAAAAALVVGIVAAGRLGSVEPASATELVTQAAQATGDASSFRGRLVVEENGTVRSSELTVDGPDIQVVGDDQSASFTLLGDLLWEGPGTTPSSVPPDGRLAPFGPSCEAVILAALRSETTVEVGEEEVRGQPATHYRIELDPASRAALGRLTPGELAWFELEYPEQALTVDVWVGDGLIRRIRVASKWDANETGSGDLVTTTEFYDFGAEVAIEAPS